jgi:hypothetical protein
MSLASYRAALFRDINSHAVVTRTIFDKILLFTEEMETSVIREFVLVAEAGFEPTTFGL